jgi:FkbM family methyltransferase
VSDSYRLLAQLGVAPTTLLDIGAAGGTPELFAAFPDAGLVLFEPLAEFRGDLDRILATRRGILVEAAAGPEAGETVFHVHQDQLEGSSLLQESMGAFADGDARHVRLVRVDDVVPQDGFGGPYLLKVDVQGAELQVLAGCTGILPETVAICLEVSLFEFMRGTPGFATVIATLADLGFVVWDITGGWTRPLDGALGQVDIVFVPEGSPLRASQSFATEEQYRAMRGTTAAASET